MKFITNTINKIKSWNAKRLWNNHHEATIKAHGWDAKCHGCQKWYNTDGVGRYLCESEMHWHYKCTNCGHKAKYILTIMPIYDGESDVKERDFPYSLYDIKGFRYYRRRYEPMYGGMWPTYHFDCDDTLIADFKTEIQYCKEIGFRGRVYPMEIRFLINEHFQVHVCNSVESGDNILAEIITNIMNEAADHGLLPQLQTP